MKSPFLRRRPTFLPALALCLAGTVPAAPGGEVSGFVRAVCGDREVPLGAMRVFATPLGNATAPSRVFRSWETEPAGWWRIDGPVGDYRALITGPAHFARPVILGELRMGEGKSVAAPVHPPFMYCAMPESEWDNVPADAYFQPFVARGTSATHVGFKFASDGVDGGGPGSQDVRVSLHRRVDGPPDTWPQVGPAATVVGVDCGGPKNYHFSAGWHSGEVPLEPGTQYAVCLRPAVIGGRIQAFWGTVDDPALRCVRIDGGAAETADRQLWLTVAGDGDGLVLPVNKRVHREFGEFAGFAPRWSQSWTARGRSLAGVCLYAATGGTQPPMERQRLRVRVFPDGGEDPEPVGTAKIAVGNGAYTGDASWGAFGVAFAEGEVPLVPGRRYRVEFATLETAETIGDFVNAKGQRSDGKPGFNPYRRHHLDPLDDGEALRNGSDPVPYDLDLQIVEYLP